MQSINGGNKYDSRMSGVCVVKRDIAGRAEDEHPLNRDRKFDDVSE